MIFLQYFLPEETKTEEENEPDRYISGTEHLIFKHWPKDRPPEGTLSGTGLFLDDLVQSIFPFLRDTRCRVVNWICPPQGAQGAIEYTANFSAHLEEKETDHFISGMEYIILIHWPKARPPEGPLSGTGYFPDDFVRDKTIFLRDTKCCVVIWLCFPQDVQGGIEDTAIFSADLTIEQEKEFGLDISLFRVEYATLIL